jgi:hypothetical protein
MPAQAGCSPPLERRIAVRAPLAETTSITLDPDRPSEREVARGAGAAELI